MSSAKLSHQTRNPDHLPAVVLGEGHDHRPSEPAPSSQPQPTPPKTGAGIPPDPAPVEGSKPRLCRRCYKTSPEAEFIRWDRKHEAVRNWCGRCLVARGHSRQRDLDAARRDLATRTRKAARDHERLIADEAARRADLVRTQQHVAGLALAMHDAATEDPAYADALWLAASALGCPRADLAALAGQQ